MIQPLGVAVIGAGVMGERHARVFAELPDTELVAVADIDEARAANLGACFGVRGFTNAEEAITRTGVDVVSICTSDQAHVEPCRLAAGAGKHILLEKPLATSVADAEEIIKACQDAGVLLMVGHILRFDPRYAEAQRVIATGGVGEIIHLYGRRNNVKASGRRIAGRTNVAFFLGVHDIDVMRWYVGDEVRRAYAIARTKVLAEFNTPDTIFALLSFDNGVIASLETCWAMPEGTTCTLDARLDVVGTDGMVNVEVRGGGLRVVDDRTSSRPDVCYGPVVAGRQAGALRTQLEHFVECVRTGRDPIITPHDALQAVRVAEAITQSLESGQDVVLP
jgi:UDP-N-acetylglucosamine 3-dehydrogenase